MSSKKSQAVAIAPIRTSSDSTWIAIDPSITHREFDPVAAGNALPSFESAQFDIVLRRQRQRPSEGGGSKTAAITSRFLHLSNDFQFAGWGTMSHTKLDSDDLSYGERTLSEKRQARNLGQFTATSLAGNAVLGSVFYATPAVVSVSAAYSPISLFIATLIIFLWRPIMVELASAMPISGAPYSYLLNISSKSMALISAALLLLDFSATAVVSAATALSYLAAEVNLPFAESIGTIILISLFLLVSLAGLRESAKIALTVFIIHASTMAVLLITSAYTWAKSGNAQIAANWSDERTCSSSACLLRQIFNGVCIGVLGLTGFECVPSYAASIRLNRFPDVLRNLHYPAIVLNVLLMLFSLAIIPLDTILAGANILSVLAEMAAGRWMRVWVVVDAIIVLCGGIITGILSGCELIESLAHDRVLPGFLVRQLPLTRARPLAILAFGLFSGAVYGISGGSLPVVSKMFSLVWLLVMSLFPLAALLLKFNRGRISRSSHANILTVLLALALAPVIVAGNIVIDPTILGYAAAYVLVLIVLFLTNQRTVRILHGLYWILDQTPILYSFAWVRRRSLMLVRIMRRTKKQPVCCLVRTDEINLLFKMALYVSTNEETSCMKLVHFFDENQGVPSEMEANWKILDEAFPEITVDLILVPAIFSPTTVIALAHHLKIPTSLFFMGCPGPRFSHSFEDFGTRIVSI